MVGSHEIEQDGGAFAEKSWEWCEQTTQATSQRVSWWSIPENTGPAGACSEHFNFHSDSQPHTSELLLCPDCSSLSSQRDRHLSPNLNAAYAYSCDYTQMRGCVKNQVEGLKMHAVIGRLQWRTTENQWEQAFYLIRCYHELYICFD